MDDANIQNQNYELNITYGFSRMTVGRGGRDGRDGKDGRGGKDSGKYSKT